MTTKEPGNLKLGQALVIESC